MSGKYSITFLADLDKHRILKILTITDEGVGWKCQVALFRQQAACASGQTR